MDLLSVLREFDQETNHTVKKEIKIFLIYKEIQKESCMRKEFLIYELMRKYVSYIGRPLVIYVFALDLF